MRRTLVALALLSLAVLGPGLRVAGRVRAQTADCSNGRADVASLTDPETNAVDPTQIIGVNISTLAAVPVPDTAPEHSRFDPYETTIFRAMGSILGAYLLPNGDIVAVIQDPATQDTVTAVFPDPTGCAAGAPAAYLTPMEQARDNFLQTFGAPGAGSVTPLSGTVLVTGIGFLDPVQGQQGEAPNGLELRPVLGFQAAPGAGAAPGSPSTRGSASTVPASTPSP